MFFKNLWKNRSSQEKVPYQVEVRDKITVLAMEYQNIHQRVSQHVEMGRQDTLQAFVFAGAILFFSINSFYNTEAELFVNISMCILLPIIAFSLVASILSINIKICSYGEYLATIEQRINQTLLYSIDSDAPADKKIVDWEHWRITHGIAREKIVFFDGAILYISLIPGAFVSFIIRLVYINDSLQSNLKLWVFITPILFSILLTFLIVLVKKLHKYEKRIKNVFSHEEIVYGKIEKVDAQQKRKSNVKLLLITIGIYFLIIIFLFTFIPFSFSVHNSKLNWLDNQIIAHRGLHNEECPENTLSAFSNAISHGYGIELDVWFSKDMIPMVVHDKNLERLCQKDQIITEMTYAEIRQLKVLEKEQIPTLQEVLALIDGKVPVIIEIKAYFPSNEENEILADILMNYDGMYAIQSFSPFPLHWMSERYPDIPRGQLYADWGIFSLKNIFCIRDNLFSLISRPNYIGYDKNVMARGSSLNQAQKHGIPIVVWLFKIETQGKIDEDGCFSNGYIVEVE